LQFLDALIYDEVQYAAAQLAARATRLTDGQL
jgi:hypothetical protein